MSENVSENPKYKIHVVSHTHWDREWRLTFQEFRMKLVDCIDHLLDIMEKQKDYKYFTLDGQCSLIEDYLEIRPENIGRIKKLAQTGRLLLGPWYTLVDEAVINGECIIRNIMKGHKVANDLGRVMKVGYGISSFGHISQLPQIFNTFGIENVIFSRGISDWQTKSEFLWESPDGTKALAFHLPDDYTKSNWFYIVYRPAIIGMPADVWSYNWGTLGLPFHACDLESINNFYRLLDPQLQYDPKLNLERVLQLRDECSRVATNNNLLAMDGVDHLEPNPLLAKLIKDVSKKLVDIELVHSNLEIYMQDVIDAIGDISKLEVIKGEMRRPTREGIHNPLLASVLSARTYLKIINKKTENALLRYAEPWNVVGSLLGFDYPKPYLDIAWKMLMHNHAHDSICGCSIDAVHNQMEDRFAQSKTIADELTQRVFWNIVPEINNGDLADDEIAITVFNSLLTPRNDVITVGIDFPEDFGAKNIIIKDINGNELPVQLKSIEKICPEMLNPMNAQLSPHVYRFVCSFNANNISSLGWTTFIAQPLTRNWLRHLGSLAPEPNVLENEFLRVIVNSEGTFDLTDKRRGETYYGLHYFEDRGENGDAWKHIPPMYDEIILSKGASAKIALIDNGPVFAQIKIEITMNLPEEVLPQKPKMIVEEAEPAVAFRSKKTVPFVITSYLKLKKGSDVLEIETHINNNVKDHRLRVLFPSNILDAEISASDCPFDVVERQIKLEDTSGWKEQAYSTHPQQHFVDVSNGENGIAILSEGLPEFAVIDDSQRTIAITLLRCLGRSIGEDWGQQGAQCLRPHVFRYAIYPHAGQWDKAEVFRKSLEFQTPLKATQSIKYSKGNLPKHLSFMEVIPSNIIVSALKKSEDGSSFILRLYNPTKKIISSTIKFPFKKIISASIVNSLEETIEELKISGGGLIMYDIPMKKIMTLKIKFE